MFKASALGAAFLALALLLCLPPAARADALADAQAAYAKRADLAQAKKAVELYRQAVAADPAGEKALFGLGAATYWLGRHLPDEQAIPVFEQTIKTCQDHLAKNPKSLAAHYWLGVNWSAYGQAKGVMKSLDLVDPIKKEMQAVIDLDPSYENGGAWRVLGRVYFKVPGLFGGSNSKSIKNLRKALSYSPNNMRTKLFLAETLLDEDQNQEAKKLLQSIIAGPAEPGFEPEWAEWKATAAKLLKKAE